ncbi:MAG TPA: class I fructose-bisphosphate aldolase, partial [Acidimicrobiia bacterium]|nr:class I fructose-bisphosphate aldolase [Acidimicrobiia bacterium]
MNEEQLRKMRDGAGFIAALDQSGGSTPKALKLYGIEDGSWSNDEEMFGLIHDMRARIIKSPSFNGDRVLAAILFEKTMDSQIDGLDTGDYLWSKKNIVPILKIDKGLADESDDVQLMKPMPDLDSLLERGAAKNMFGTKERSVIKMANPEGVQAIADQQFEIGRQVL